MVQYGKTSWLVMEIVFQTQKLPLLNKHMVWEGLPIPLN